MAALLPHEECHGNSLFVLRIVRGTTKAGGIFRFVVVESSVCSNIEQDVSKSLHCFVVVDVAALPVVVVANMR